MKYKILTILLLSSIFLNAQNKFFRKKYPWKGNNQFLDKVLLNYPELDSSVVYYKVPISLHIYLNKREDKTFLNSSIKKAIQNLNKIFSKNKTGIQFYISDIHYINNQKRLKISSETEIFLTGLQLHNPSSINVYYTNVMERNILTDVTFYKGVYNRASNSIILIRHCSRTTLAHEIGHYFGLMHPHRNYDKYKLRQEPVSRTRKSRNGKFVLCQVRGDYLSDTPAEPVLSNYVTKKCEYTGNLTDCWGDKYKPSTNNIMSYLSYTNCRKAFTRQQKAVMLYNIENKKYAKYWKNTAENEIFDFDIYEPDDAMSMASEIKENQTQTHTFHYTLVDKHLILNNCDWISFEMDTCKNAKLIFTESDKNFATIIVNVFDSSFRPVANFELNKAGKAKISNLTKGKYFVKIKSISNKKDTISGYNVKFTTF